MNRLVAIDIETYDPNLHRLGDGSCRTPGSSDDDGSCILCVGTFDGQVAKPYYPNTQGWIEFLSLMADEHVDKVYHNGVYDLAWLVCRYSCAMKGLQHDTMTRMVYIDEYADLSLDACCKYFRVQGKNKNETIENWYQQHFEQIKETAATYGVKIKKTDQLWKYSLFLWEHWPEFREQMVMYNLQDCRATWNLFQAQESKLPPSSKNMYMIDIGLTPHIITMKKKGVLIDRDAVKKLTDNLYQDIDKVSNQLETVYGITDDMIGSSIKLGKRLNTMGIHSSVRTSTGAESWGAIAMNRIAHIYPVIPLIIELKGYKKLLSTYMEGGLIDSILSDGRIHCTFSPNKREDGGTVTGRFACSKPNLQQIPKRGKAFGHSYGKDMRSLFIPEENCMMVAMDYAQIEYLLLANYSVGQQAEWFKEQARAGVDFHTVAMQITGIKERRAVKDFNYGVIYGMGWKTALERNYLLWEQLAAQDGTPVAEYVERIYNTYKTKLYVVNDTMKYVENQTKLRGYISTIGGRLEHKPHAQYDPVTGKINDFIYKMLNKLLQGSAADILKTALYNAVKAGVFNTLTMHITVHDENVCSLPYNKEGLEAALELKHYMDTAYKDQLSVPMKAETDVGPNWGYWDSDIWKDMQNGIFNKQNLCWWYK